MGIKKKLGAFAKLPLGKKLKTIGKKALEAAPGLEQVAGLRVGMTNPTGTGTSPLAHQGGTDKVVMSQLSDEGKKIVAKLERLGLKSPGEYIG
tara:strand:+ start:206 stop:484 length:279 start_codon:yes stop_codon:yes gene_type:complete